jgi:hypothetical protein
MIFADSNAMADRFLYVEYTFHTALGSHVEGTRYQRYQLIPTVFHHTGRPERRRRRKRTRNTPLGMARHTPYLRSAKVADPRSSAVGDTVTLDLDPFPPHL